MWLYGWFAFSIDWLVVVWDVGKGRKGCLGGKLVENGKKGPFDLNVEISHWAKNNNKFVSIWPGGEIYSHLRGWKKKFFSPFFSWYSYTIYSLSLHFDSVHYVHWKWFLYIKTRSSIFWKFAVFLKHPQRFLW